MIENINLFVEYHNERSLINSRGKETKLLQNEQYTVLKLSKKSTF